MSLVLVNFLFFLIRNKIELFGTQTYKKKYKTKNQNW